MFENSVNYLPISQIEEHEKDNSIQRIVVPSDALIPDKHIFERKLWREAL